MAEGITQALTVGSLLMSDDQGNEDEDKQKKPNPPAGM